MPSDGFVAVWVQKGAFLISLLGVMVVITTWNHREGACLEAASTKCDSVSHVCDLTVFQMNSIAAVYTMHSWKVNLWLLDKQPAACRQFPSHTAALQSSTADSRKGS